MDILDAVFIHPELFENKACVGNSVPSNSQRVTLSFHDLMQNQPKTGNFRKENTKTSFETKTRRLRNLRDFEVSTLHVGRASTGQL